MGMRFNLKADDAGLKEDLCGQIVGGWGSASPRPWRGMRYPEGRPSINSVAYVWSRAPDIVDAFERGVPIVARNHRFLAVPTKDAGREHTPSSRSRPVRVSGSRIQLRNYHGIEEENRAGLAS
jgi:hypothetical protein